MVSTPHIPDYSRSFRLLEKKLLRHVKESVKDFKARNNNIIALIN